jgi:hypothetical protein
LEKFGQSTSFNDPSALHDEYLVEEVEEVKLVDGCDDDSILKGCENRLVERNLLVSEIHQSH